MPRTDNTPVSRYAPCALAICAGIAFSVAAAYIVWKLQVAGETVQFEQRSANVISSVRARIEANLEIVRSIASFSKSSVEVTRDEFRLFTAPSLSGSPGIQALEWVPRVLAEERASYEQTAREEGYTGFQITERSAQGELVPAAQRPEYFPVFYAEPITGNEAAVGYDLASCPRRLRALKDARDTGMTRATARITLIQEEEKQHALLVFVPVYHLRGGPYRDEIEQRRSSLVGFAVGVFRIRDLVAAALSSGGQRLRSYGRHLDLYLYDEGVTGDERLLLFYSSSQPYRPSLPLKEHEARSGTHFAETFAVAGRDWTVVVKPSRAVAVSQGAWEPWAALLVGLASTVALAAYLLLGASRTHAIEQLVERQKAELETASDELRRRISEHEAAEAALQERTKLAKYLSPQVYTSISAGKQPVEITSRRKKLSVCFCDIANFTEIAERLESEEVTEILNRYLTEMTRIGLQYGATIDKYIGDGILFFFGDPETCGVKEDALACTKMAIAMQRRLQELQVDWEALGVQAALKCRIGISTGYCTVGNFGSEQRMEYTIIGRGVNLASRLEAAAPPGGILISHETYALVKGEICCEERPRLHVKGAAAPVANYQVIKVDVDLPAMSAREREQTTEVSDLALSRLTEKSESG